MRGSRGTSGLGVVIEAMSVIYSLTGDEETGLRLHRAIASALYTLGERQWLGSNGVLFNRKDNSSGYPFPSDGDDGDMYFLRGLAEAHRRDRGTLPAKLRDDIKIILGVHYNAIRDLTTSGDNVYARDWPGPRPTQVTFDLYNQVAAAQILIDGISLFNSSDDTPPSPSSPSSPSPRPHDAGSPRPGAAVIAGATAGSVVLALIMLTAFGVIRQRRRRRLYAGSSAESDSTTAAIIPFVTTSQKRTTLSHKRPVPDLEVQVVSPQARFEPLRRHNSAPSSFQDATNMPGDHRHTFALSIIDAVNAGDDGTRHQERGQPRENLETTLTVPHMVRELYQRLLQPNAFESPPEYHSDVEEPPQRG
ncbi:hypothetical protein PQX77_012912 [Marasmius sp. AFHP31]|nr:hypothetical protein PQX77_012912 [Marasmius sp. AFHP31]